MVSHVCSATLYGINSRLVSVESCVCDGLPSFELVGVLSPEVRESRERVRTVLKNCGFSLPSRRMIVNFTPADLRKSGNGFDLPIAVSVLTCLEIITSGEMDRMFFAGELSLEGKVLPVKGILPMVLAAKESGRDICVIPAANVSEARLVSNIKAVGVHDLLEVYRFLMEGIEPEISSEDLKSDPAAIEKTESKPADFADISGQENMKRACEVAVAGMHNLLFIGPPGSGKTMMARCIPSILPPLNDDEKLELTKIYSVGSQTGEDISGQRIDRLMEERPFRAPHHTITKIAMTGGGAVPRPGEISLAHKGVLFLDELPEFDPAILETLRQPLEEKQIRISRNSCDCTFPADFLLACAMNPCKCGYFPSPRCTCSTRQIRGYLGRISQPLLDRIDITSEAKKVSFLELMTSDSNNESSADIRKRIMAAQEIQKKRFKGTGLYFNSQIPSSRLKEYCRLGSQETRFMEIFFEKYSLTARTYNKMIKVARTIADLSGSDNIRIEHLEEAGYFRCIDKKFWEGHYEV